MDKNGELIKGQFDPTVVRGGNEVGGNPTTRPMDSGAPIWLEGRSTDGNATNSLGGIGGDTKSDPMFDKFKHEASGWGDENKASGSQSAEGVASKSMPVPSDPQGQELADEQQLGQGALSSQADKD